MILIASALVLVVVIMAAVMLTRKEARVSSDSKDPQSPSATGTVVGDKSAVIPSTGETLKGQEPGAAGKSGVGAKVASIPSSGTAASSRASAPVTETPAKPSSPCQIADLKSDVKDLKGHLNEFRLARTLESKEPLCVTVDGKSVATTRLKDGRVRIDTRIAKTSAKVSALFCSEGVKCKISCPEPEKDFWDSIGSDEGLVAGTGFAENESSQDKELQKEIKALKDVLNRKPTEAPVALWAISAQRDSSCQ
jgi:hypothetical protein